MKAKLGDRPSGVSGCHDADGIPSTNGSGEGPSLPWINYVIYHDEAPADDGTPLSYAQSEPIGRRNEFEDESLPPWESLRRDGNDCASISAGQSCSFPVQISATSQPGSFTVE